MASLKYEELIASSSPRTFSGHARKRPAGTCSTSPTAVMRLRCLLVDEGDRRSFELSSGQVAGPSMMRTRSIRVRVLFINKLDIETTTPAYRRKKEACCRRVYSSRVRL
jgi:hypothetical protein